MGVSGDPVAATGLNAGCQVWYSVIAGTLPGPALHIARSAQAGASHASSAASQRLQPLWDLFAQHGSLRAVSTVAELIGLVARPSLPLPIRGLVDDDRARVAPIIDHLDLR
ncbi:dihydrodipicolinate synthase family protein [Amycolatopsis anabasis]|uniref:dihydrodipicolinate synthase family protein n=1 Tax=Amycolatopsis anabasis TaxID=1840409 RepID=UPI001FE2BA80|nr:dihydrodipicolinate synthase family protein [Amycolatopsis anabasis]